MRSIAARVRWVVCVVVAVGVLTGCTSLNRVAIEDAPAEGAPRGERLAYHRKYKAKLATKKMTTTEGAKEVTTHVFVDDGVRIEHPADLLPAVGQDTPAGKSALEFEEALESNNLWAQIALWPLPVGLGAPVAIWAAGFGVEFLLSQALPNGGRGYVALSAVIAGGAICVAAPVVHLVGLCVWGSKERDMYRAREAAFQSYNESLEIHLRLDNNALDDVDTEAASSSSSSGDDATSDGAALDDEGFDEGMQGW